MLKDLRYGVRALLQAKGWTAVVVVLLAPGIGPAASTALAGYLPARRAARIDPMIALGYE